MDVVKFLEDRAKDFPDKPAVIFQDNPITFRKLRDTVFTLANNLISLGVKKGDKVAIYLPNWPEYIYSYLAVWSLGATVVPLDYMLTDAELASCLSHCQASALFFKSKPHISLDKIKQACPSLKRVIMSREQSISNVSFEELLARVDTSAPQTPINDKDLAIIFYTSGTTGRPKGVMINYLQLSAPPKSMDFFVDLTHKDITLCALPFSHLGGLIYIQNCLAFGLTVVLLERFIPLEFLKNIQKYRVSCFWIVPSMYYAILQLKEFENFDLSSLRWIVTFGASSSVEALRRFNRFCPNAHILNGWGLTETNAPTTVIPLGSDKIESVGRPAPWIEVKILDDSGRELSAGEIGEVAVKSWVVTEGYYNDEKATHQAIRKGWFYSGDLGRIDADGHLYIVGRKKEMIKVGGEIVFEPEVEAALYKHPDIAEAAVVGTSDKLRGEVPKAFVILKDGKNITESELRYFLREHLAHFKIPHYFEFVPSLPKNRSGKIDKEQLRANVS